MTADLSLEYRTPEQQLLTLLRRWAPASGYGRVSLELIYQGGQIVIVTKHDGEESIKL